MTSLAERQQLLDLVEEARQAGARYRKCASVIGLTVRTMERWRSAVAGDGRKAAAALRGSKSKLTPSEHNEILTVVNQPRFAHQSPKQVVPILADEGCYIASESSFYRVMREAKQMNHRGPTKALVRQRPEPLTATGPNQVWSWDITYLASTVKGQFFFLYLFLDIFSRKIVGWEVYETQTAELAQRVVAKACLREQISKDQLRLHSDNGSPMKGATMLATLERLGVMPSFSRPSVSNDNAFSESAFRTLKYSSRIPSKPFDSVDDAREWVSQFVDWYNLEHRHSSIKFVTPEQRHHGEDVEILAQRNRLYLAARERDPQRWSGDTRNWEPVGDVSLNPQNTKREVA
jgi:transposase InsO family protein